MNVYELIKEAIKQKSPIRVTHQGHSKDVCPHVIGITQDRQQVLTYQFGGFSSSGLPPKGDWRCLKIADISHVEAISGPWRTGTNHSQRQSCVAQIDTEIAI